MTARPFRTHASKPLAAALAALSAGGLGAQGLSFGQSQNTAQRLAGEIVMPIGPTVVELIDPDAAEALIARVFTEAGYTLREEDVPVGEDLEAEAWDSERRVGFAILEAGDFSDECAWAQFLQETFGSNRRLSDDPRDRLDAWGEPLDSDAQGELTHATAHAAEERVELSGSAGGHILCLGPSDLVARESVQWGSLPQPSVGERVAALQRLEVQVREYIEYLRSQGI